MKTVFLSVSFLISSWLGGNPGVPASKVSLQKRWETEATLKTPESVLYDAKKNVLYVANIDGKPDGKDGQGFISKLSLDGKIETLEWVSGLDAPKGMGVHNSTLYVADLTQVVVIDTQTGKITKRITAEGASFLNDVTVGKDGSVFVSDSNANRIYRIEGDKAVLWLDDTKLQKPNGLLAEGDHLNLLDMGDGLFYKIDLKTKKMTQFTQGITFGDGVVAAGDGYLVSNWNGEVYFVSKDGKVESLLDTKAQKINAADIEYIPSKKLLLVPTFFDNRVVAYELTK